MTAPTEKSTNTEKTSPISTTSATVRKTAETGVDDNDRRYLHPHSCITVNDSNSTIAIEEIVVNNNNNKKTTVELSEIFYITNKRKNVRILVKLTADGVYLRRETEETDQINEQVIRIEDIIGSHCGPRIKKRLRGGLTSCRRLQEGEEEKSGASIAKDNSAYLYIFAYVKRDKPLRRVQAVRILRFRTYDRYEDNLKTAESWHQGIRLNKSKGKIMERKHLLVLLNPKSGSGKGRDMFQKQVAPILKEADVQYDLQVTTHPNHARELIRSKKDLLHRYSGIVVASGDGLFYEVLNGIMDHMDWRLLCRKMPIGIIPCGSGNGLAKSIAHCFDEPYEPKPILNSTLSCVSGNTALMDIVRVEISKGNQTEVVWSFLSVGWGLIADIDIESERLRSIGAPRFTIWSIHRLISLRTYKGKVSYLPWKALKEECSDYPLFVNGETYSSQKPERGQKSRSEFYDVPEEGADENFFDSSSLDGRSIKTQHDSWHSATSRLTTYYSIGGQSIRSNRSAAGLSIVSKIQQANAELEQKAPVTSIPPISESLDNDEAWHHEEGDFVMVHAAYTTHLASDCLFAPKSKLNDGIIYLVIIRAGVGRSQLMQFLLNLSSGTHVTQSTNGYIEVKRVKAFRIVPKSLDGIMTVDGERVNHGPIQGEIFPGMINVMVPNNSITTTNLEIPKEED